MDEARATAAVDLVRRPHAEIALAFTGDRVGGLALTLLPHALERFAIEAGCTVHVEAAGEDDHHVAEAAFKALGRALREACSPAAPASGSTKGSAVKVVARRLRRRQPAQRLLRARARGRGAVRDRRIRTTVREAPLAVIAGVGHVASAAAGLARTGVAEALRERAAPGGRVLGICVGMQLLFEESEEGGAGLGLLAGPCARLRGAPRAAHGLEHARGRGPASTLLDGPRRRGRLLRPPLRGAARRRRGRPSPRSTTTGRVVAAVEQGALAGVQFHPERSGPAGARAPRERAAMVKKRVIPCLDVADGRVVKGVRFENLRDMGDPVELATRYSELGADELVFLDITATLEGRGPLLELVERAAAELDDPVHRRRRRRRPRRTRARCSAPAPTRSRSTAPRSTSPALLDGLADEFGSQAVVCAIDARGGEVVTHAGRNPRGIDAVDWAAEAVEPRRGRDAAHLDRRRRHARRLRPRADRRGRRRR